MFNFRSFIILCAILVTANYSYADDIIAKCSLTPSLNNNLIAPEEFKKSNNLRRKTASPLPANGDAIIIKGRVFDKNCVPIPRAIVNIWHNDSNGYNYMDSDNMDSNFLGSGTVATDNLGFFKFLTIKPEKSKDDKYVAIDFQITHKYLEIPFTSLLFLNSSDAKKYGSDLSDANLNNLVTKYDKNTNTYFLDIVLDVNSNYRSF